MSQHYQFQAHPSNASMPGRSHNPSMGADDSSTFVKPLQEGSSQSFSPYTFSTETAIPPPPPGMYSPLVSQPKRKRGYLITIVVLTVLVVTLGSLEVVQLAAQTPLTTYPSGSAGSNQAGITTGRHAAAPVRTLTPGTIKEQTMLTCSGCDNPILTTITAIMVDTTNLRTVWSLRLKNESGAQQIDYFAEFSLQDPFGHTYEGTGDLNTDYFLDAGQTAVKTEIFSFLPRPGVSYTLVARLGISGITYDPLQVTF
jgi:hypothetical protein